MKININKIVKVRLTEHGIHYLENYHGHVSRCLLGDNVLTIELWNLMSIFGNEMYNGNINSCFIDNEIEFIGV